MSRNIDKPLVGVYKLVIVHGLQSERGQLMNGRFGYTTADPDGETGRYEVTLFTVNKEGLQWPVTSVPGAKMETARIKPENLKDHPDQKCEQWRDVIKTKVLAAFDQQNPAAFKKVENDMTGYVMAWPGDVATVATIANMMREIGKVGISIEILQNILSGKFKIPPEIEAQKYILTYDLAAALLAAGRLSEACSWTLKIKNEGLDYAPPGPDVLRREMLELLMNAYKKPERIVASTDPAIADEECTVLRALLEMKPKFGLAMWNLGAALCRSGRLDEGLVYYQKACDEGEGLSEMDKKIIRQAIGVAGVQRAGSSVAAVVSDSNGNPSFIPL